MTLDLAFTPAGRITVQLSDGDREDRGGGLRDRTSDNRLARIVKAFQSSSAEGLFTLATQPLDTSWAPSLGYWRDFAARYLSELCQTPQGADKQVAQIPLPGAGELASMLLCVPPMPGAEYVIATTWRAFGATSMRGSAPRSHLAETDCPVFSRSGHRYGSKSAASAFILPKTGAIPTTRSLSWPPTLRDSNVLLSHLSYLPSMRRL